MSADDRGDDPDHRSRFEVVGKCDATDINGIPSEAFANARDLFFCFCIVTAKKHVRRTARKLGLVKVRVPDGVERLDDKRPGQSLLIQLAAGSAEAADELGCATGHFQWVRGVNNNLASEIFRAGDLNRFYG